MSKFMVGSKQIISIQEFMQNYVGVIYSGKDKLTHEVMEEYLLEKGVTVPKRVRASFSKINQESFLRGDILLVKDKIGQILMYRNPYRISNRYLLETLHQDALQLKKVRSQILEQMGYTLLENEEIIETKELCENSLTIIDKDNSQKIFLKKYK